jgi:hypothetical protein
LPVEFRSSEGFGRILGAAKLGAKELANVNLYSMEAVSNPTTIWIQENYSVEEGR